MRHAPQIRFNLHAAGIEQRVMAYTLEQMQKWTETDWNWHMREALRAQGFRTFHIREASETGIADLIVYRRLAEVNKAVYRPTESDPFGGTWKDKGQPLQAIEAWLELKKDNDIADVRPSQKQFMRDHWRESKNALFVMFDRKVGMLAVRQGDLLGRVKMYPAYPYAVKWQEVFDHFKTRKVSVL